MTNATENPFENLIRHDLHQYLTGLGAVDSRLPECPDVEALWPALCQAYLPDGIREFDQYPVVSLGWPMFLGMAVAKYWDEDWEKHSRNPDLYTTLRDRRGFDHMDDYILESVLRQSKDTRAATAGIVAECAARTLSSPHRPSLRSIRRMPAPALRHGHGHATQSHGLPHDADSVNKRHFPALLHQAGTA